MTTARQRLTLRRDVGAGQACTAGRRRPTRKKNRPLWPLGQQLALRCFGYRLASQSRAATRSRVPTAMAKAHTFSASQVAVFPNVLKSQETNEPIIPGRAAAALSAKLARARPGPVGVFHPTLPNRSCQVTWEPAPAHFPRRR